MDSKAKDVAEAPVNGAHGAQASGNFGGFLLGLGLAGLASVLVFVAHKSPRR